MGDPALSLGHTRPYTCLLIPPAVRKGLERELEGWGPREVSA